MSRDLGQLLRDTAVEPSIPVDPAALRLRGRRRRRLRHAGAVAGSAVAAALATVLVLAGPVAGPQPPEVVDRPEVSESDDDGEDGSEDPPPAGRQDGAEDTTEDGGGREDQPQTVTVEESGWSLLVSGDSGVDRVNEAAREQLWDGSVIAARSDLAGGVVVQEHNEGPILWLPADAEEPQPALATEQRPVLHAVVDRDGRPTVLFTRRTGEGEGEEETLYAHRLEDGTEEALGITARYESALTGAALVDGDLLLSICHLECRLTRLPWGADPEGDQAVDLNDGQPLPTHGLDAQEGIAAYVHMLPQHLEIEGEDEEAHLWLHDIASNEQQELALPPPDLEEPWTADVELTGDATAALVRFYRPDRPADGQTLLMEDLDGQPQLRWLATTERVHFDEAALQADTE